VWPLVLAAHLHSLRHIDALPPAKARSWVHSAGVWLLMLLGGNLLYWAVEQAGLWHTAWATVVMLAAASTVLLVLGSQPLFDTASSWRQRWPLNTQAYAYLWRGAAPVALLVLLGALGVALTSRGNTAPLPYVPLLNPTDLSVALGLAVCALWMQRLRASNLPLPALARDGAWKMAWLAVAFVAINTVWLRMAHHFGGVPWQADALFDSFLVQAGYSLLWTLLALALMLTAHRRQTRTLWMGGAALLGLTVLKLLLIDLSNRGGGERIVTFIGVGVLMLVMGYFCRFRRPPTLQRNNRHEVPLWPHCTRGAIGSSGNGRAGATLGCAEVHRLCLARIAHHPARCVLGARGTSRPCPGCAAKPHAQRHPHF
jgi:uncharacterized membrane protein